MEQSLGLSQEPSMTGIPGMGRSSPVFLRRTHTKEANSDREAAERSRLLWNSDLSPHLPPKSLTDT